MTDDDLIGFEPLDDDVRRRLVGEGASGIPPDAVTADEVLARLTPRFRRARHRHRVAVTGSVLGVVVLVALGSVLVAAADRRGRAAHIPPADTITADGGTTALRPEPTTSAPPGGGSAPGANPASDDRGGSAARDGGSQSPSVTTSPPAAIAPSTRTYNSAGGSATVRLQGGALSIVSTQPAAGFTEERHDTGPDRVEVRFTDTKSGVEWRIRVDVGANGEQQAEITQH